MILGIKDNNNNKLGTITFSLNNEPICDDRSDPRLQEFVLASLKDGINRAVDRMTEEGNLALVIEPVSQTDPLFPLAFKEFLERSGYGVIEKHPEVEEEIRRLLSQFPADNPDKKDILERLSEMSYLEQSTILEGLKQIAQDK